LVAENFTFQITNKSQEPKFRIQTGGVPGRSALIEGTGVWELAFGYWYLFGLPQRDSASIMPEGSLQSLSEAKDQLENGYFTRG
jgi:hypothetical protein